MRNYADEDLPAWQSTMQNSFDVKHYDGQLVSKQSAILANATNFVMASLGATKNPISVSKQDFVKHEYSNAPSRFTQNTSSKYSLISCEEMGPPLSKRLIRPPPKTSIRASRVSPNVDDEKLPKNISHVSFGNEIGNWTSVSKQSMLEWQVERVQRIPTEYERLEKKTSSVLDNPDLILDSKLETVSQQAYKSNDNLDRATLIHDNSKSRHALSGTHFSLGNETKNLYKSEYDSTFLSQQNQRTKAIKAENSNHLAVIAEDYSERKIGMDTTSRSDFQKPRLPQRAAASDIKVINPA